MREAGQRLTSLVSVSVSQACGLMSFSSRLDQRGDNRPIHSALVAAGEQCVLPIKRHRPFILPMSAKSGRFIIVGIPISAERENRRRAGGADRRGRATAFALERLLGLDGRPAMPSGLCLPEYVLDAAHVVSRARSSGIMIDVQG